MYILISHWHCIIPAAAILLAMVIMRGKDSDEINRDENKNLNEE